jgi:hypothetical protein
MIIDCLSDLANPIRKKYRFAMKTSIVSKYKCGLTDAD